MKKYYRLMSRMLFVVGLGLIFISSQSFAQSSSVSGTIKDTDTGDPIPGANVLIKGTSNGTVTDIDGNYTIVVDQNSTLVFSFVGYATQEVVVGSQSTINISMEYDISQLGEIVVVGYGQQDKADVTGVVASVDEKDFIQGAIVSPQEMIVGKLAGVQVTQNSGEPGGAISIRVRGGTSINASNEPLYVIDGVPIDNSEQNSGGRNPLNFLNPNDIETFTVLKDASASAIYGSRAANGVVLITTKKGKKGEGTITYDGYFTVSNKTASIDMLEKEPFVNVVTAMAPQKLGQLGTANTDWYNELFQTAYGQSHNLSFSGGTENAGFRVSLGYQDLNGIIKTSNTKRTNLAFNYNHSFFDDQLKMDVDVKTAFTKDRFNPGVIGGALAFDPTQPIFDPSNSDLGGYFEYPVKDLAPTNPISQLNQTEDYSTYLRNIGMFKLTYSPAAIEGLSLTTLVGYDVTSGDRTRFTPSSLRSAAIDSGRVSYNAMKRINPSITAYAKYGKELANLNSKFDVTLGYEYQDFKSDYNGYEAYKLSTDVFGKYSAGVADKVEPYGNNQESRLIAFFGRLNWALNDKYLLTATLRRDGSSKFGPENQWALFPSAAIGWRVLDEGFMSGAQSVFTDLKIRAGYGVTGNQDFGNYLYLPTYTPSTTTAQYQFGNRFITTLRPNGYDSSLKWEETSSYNIGIDFGVLNNRLYGSVEYYLKNTKDLLFEVAVPAGTNLTNRVTSNIGNIQNTGIELTLNAVVLDKDDLQLTAGFNFAYNDNKITALAGDDEPGFEGFETGGISGGVGNTIQRLITGESVNSFYVYKQKYGASGNPLADGIDHNGDGVIDLADMYEDTNDDGVVNSKDRRIYNNPAPKILMGFSSGLRYKNFDLNLTMTSNLGGYVYNNIASSNGHFSRLEDAGLNVNNLESSVLETGFNQPQYFSDYYVESASFLRLDNVTIGYNYNKLNFMNLRVYASFQNVFVLSQYSGLDPLVLNGIDNDPYPRSRTMTFGVNLKF